MAGYVSYEWVIEELNPIGPDADSNDDIVDVDHAATYAEAFERAQRHKRYDIGLVRDTDTTRAWAYVTDGKLPPMLEDAFGRTIAVVPQRYRKQFDKHNA